MSHNVTVHDPIGFAIVETDSRSEHHYLMPDGSRHVMRCLPNMTDLMEHECLKRKKLKTPHPIS